MFYLFIYLFIYFYNIKANNTPLHQAARGNHVSIIHLIMNGK